MHGNASQWCSDWDDVEYYAKSPADDPMGPNSGVNRIVRGSSWYDWPEYTRSACRLKIPPHFRENLVGFRVARTP
jgi:formylglycine-generating enzyme